MEFATVVPPQRETSELYSKKPADHVYPSAFICIGNKRKIERRADLLERNSPASSSRSFIGALYTWVIENDQVPLYQIQGLSTACYWAFRSACTFAKHSLQ